MLNPKFGTLTLALGIWKEAGDGLDFSFQSYQQNNYANQVVCYAKQTCMLMQKNRKCMQRYQRTTG